MTDYLKSEKKQIVAIIVSSVMVHILLLFVSGAWWDDWKFYVLKFSELREHYIDAGRLDAYYLILPVSELPVWVFRASVLMCFTVSTIFIYFIILKSFDNRNAAFLIAILYNAVPVNDSRVLKCVYPYTVALLLFWIAFYMLILCNFAEIKLKRYTYRVISLVLFFISFSTNSLLFFYLIPMLLLWFFIGKKLSDKKQLTVSSFVKEALKWVDFYVLPVFFFIIKNIWFRPMPGGLYEGYNSITFRKLAAALIFMPYRAFQTIKEILINWISIVMKYKWLIGLFLMIILIMFLFRKHFEGRTENISFRSKLYILLFGIVLFMIGLYPYIVIRQSKVSTTGMEGRDAMLACLGVAVIIYGIIQIAKTPTWLQYAIVTCIMATSFIHFSYWYASYLKAYYEQVALQVEWTGSSDVENGKTFIYISQNKGPINAEHFYALNALSKEVYGDATRYIAGGIGELHYITSYEKKEIMKEDVTNCYNGYDLSDIEINGVMVASYNISYRDLIKLKFDELNDQGKFFQELENYVDYEFIPVDSNTSNEIYEKYIAEQIISNEELLQFLENAK